LARTHDLPPPHDAVEAAIARVLAAEAAARDAVAQARDAAAAHAEATRAAVRSVTQRTQDRIAAVRARFDRDVAAQVALLEAEAERIAHAPPMAETELAALEEALAALADELTQARQ
jgi:hypothetical protein